MNSHIENNSISDREINRLHQLTVYGRWVLVATSWILILPWALWQLRETISLCQDYFTWSAVRLGLEFNPWATLGLSFCIGFTTSVLVWQSIYILQGGLSEKQKYYLSEKVKKIRHRNKKSWLYRWLYGN
jgi:hypothetical protein